MKKSQPSPESGGAKGAPAYMGQYASLMTILLAFFIVMLSLGQSRVAQFRVGVGQIRNMIGMQGGTGVLAFWRSMRYPPVPKVIGDSNDDDQIITFQIGARDGFSLQSEHLSQISFDDTTRDLRLNTAIQFEPGRILIHRETQSSLDHITTLLHSVDVYRVDVEVWGAGNAEARTLAARRAIWITRHLVENARIPASRIRAMGLLRDEPNDVEMEEPRPQVSFLLRRTSP